MMRGVFIALLFLLASTPAFAQTCLPRCASGSHCIYVGASDDPKAATTCVKNATDGTVDEVVVTANTKGTSAGGTTFADIVNKGIVPFIDSYVIPLLYALAFLLFMVGMVRYFFTGGDENREAGRAFALWGLIGFVVLFGVWGIVRILLAAIPGT